MDPATQGAPAYYVWQPPGKPVAIHLSLDVVDRMSVDIMRGFGAVPKRGAEVGGVLVGTIEQGDLTIVNIDDFEPVPCKYIRGPSYVLGESDQMLFDQVCERRKPAGVGDTYAVGYYRSHTRDGLALAPEDIELLNQHFSSPANVALLVKPFATKPGAAGFFVREDGVFPEATPLEFPFRRWEMTGEEPPPKRSLYERKPKDQEAEIPEASGPAEDVHAAPPARPQRAFTPHAAEPSRPKSRAGVWMLASFIFLLLGVLLGYAASRITAPRRASDFALSLSVARTGDNLMVRWNRDAPAVRLASKGVLEIEDGNQVRHEELDVASLRSGSIVYRNSLNSVRFRLVVSLSSGLSVTEALEWQR